MISIFSNPLTIKVVGLQTPRYYILVMVGPNLVPMTPRTMNLSDDCNSKPTEELVCILKLFLLNLLKSIKIWIVIKLFRLIQQQTEFRLVKNQSEKCNYN